MKQVKILGQNYKKMIINKKDMIISKMKIST